MRRTLSSTSSSGDERRSDPLVAERIGDLGELPRRRARRGRTLGWPVRTACERDRIRARRRRTRPARVGEVLQLVVRERRQHDDAGVERLACVPMTGFCEVDGGLRPRTIVGRTAWAASLELVDLRVDEARLELGDDRDVDDRERARDDREEDEPDLDAQAEPARRRLIERRGSGSRPPARCGCTPARRDRPRSSPAGAGRGRRWSADRESRSRPRGRRGGLFA